MVSLGIGLGVVDAGVLGGGSTPTPPYVAKAVHFDGDAYLSNPSLLCTDGPGVSCFAWVRVATADISQQVNLGISDPQNSYNSEIYFPQTSGSVGFALNISDITSSFITVYSEDLPTGDVWLPYFASATLSFDDPNKTGLVFIGDDNVSDILSQGGAASVTAWNGLPFFIGSDSFTGNHPFDLCDFRIITNTYIDWTDEAARRLFVTADGKPVDPAVATAALGPATMLFSGDHTTFLVNQGSGGAFTLTGSLTNASTSPSD